MSSLLGSLYILKTIPLLNVGLVKIFFPILYAAVLSCYFVFCLTEDFQFQEVLFVALNVCATSGVSEGNLLYQCTQDYFSLFVLSALM